MEKKNSKILTIVISCVILVVLIAGVWLIYDRFSPKPIEGQKTITFEVVLADGSKKSHEITTTAEMLRGALEEKNLVAGTEGEYGLYVLTIDGTTADEAKQEWWCFTKGGETMMTSVDQTPIADGEHYEATLTVGW